MCTLALASCTVLFDSAESGPGSASEREEDQEFLLAMEGDMSSPGPELYLGRTIDGVSFIEPYDSSATPQLLDGRLELPFTLTAMATSRFNGPRLMIMATGDTTQDGKRDTEYIDRITWGMDETLGDAMLSTTEFRQEFGPAIPGSHSFINDHLIAPTNPHHFSTGLEVHEVDSSNGWNDLNIDPIPWLTQPQPIRCFGGHGLGLSAHEIVAFAGRNLVLTDINAQEAGQTIHDVEKRHHTMEFEMNACAYDGSENEPTYITSNGAALHAIRLNPDASFVGEVPLPGESPSHDQFVLLDLLDLGVEPDLDLVLVVADPPRVYVGLDMEVESEALDFGRAIFSQPLDFTPSAAVRVSNAADDTDWLYVSEAKGPIHCFALGTDASGLGPELVPCESTTP